MIPWMIKDLHSYHRYAIFIDDIREEDFYRGVIFGLSRAKTMPYPELTLSFVGRLNHLGRLPY